jgi:hypothetical protein
MIHSDALSVTNARHFRMLNSVNDLTAAHLINLQRVTSFAEFAASGGAQIDKNARPFSARKGLVSDLDASVIDT